MNELLVVDGYKFSLDESKLIRRHLVEEGIIERYEDAQSFLKNHKYEEYREQHVLRNPDSNGVHLAVKKF
jgi:hypothetical protein